MPKRVFVNKKNAKTFKITETLVPSTTNNTNNRTLEDDLIDKAIQAIDNVEANEGTFEQLIMAEGAAAGLKGDPDFDRLLRMTRGKDAPRGTSDDSRPPKRQSQQIKEEAGNVEKQQDGNVDKGKAENGGDGLPRKTM